MNPHAARRIKEKRIKQARFDRAARIDAIGITLRENLARPHVQDAIDRAWRERAEYRKLLLDFERAGGVKLMNRITRLVQYAAMGTKRERPWVMKGLARIWVQPPQHIWQDTYTFDIPHKVKSLKAKSSGSNPWEWKTADKLSIVHDPAFAFDPTTTARRAHIVQVEQASYPELSAWLKKAIDKIVETDERVARLEDSISRAQVSASKYASLTSPLPPAQATQARPRYTCKWIAADRVLYVYKNDEYFCSYPNYSIALACVGERIFIVGETVGHDRIQKLSVKQGHAIRYWRPETRKGM